MRFDEATADVGYIGVVISSDPRISHRILIYHDLSSVLMVAGYRNGEK